MFTTLIIQPIFNLLVIIYALLPGHNFGMAIIIFTILIRLILWPLVKKQLTHAKAMRELQPELKKIKAAAGGNRQKESQLTMELYKERGVNPFASIGILLVQLPILIGLYSSVTRIVKDPHQIVTFSYPFVHNLSWIQTLEQDISKFDDSLFGFINLGQKAFSQHGIYVPALILVALSALAQYFQSKQLLPQDKESRSLRKILSEAGRGKQADQSEVSAALTRNMTFLIPVFVFLFGLSFPAALPLYWLTSSVVAYIQQARVLREDAAEADDSVKKRSDSLKVTITRAPEAQVSKKPKRSSKKQSKRRRKK